jgi:hypothetical protein
MAGCSLPCPLLQSEGERGLACCDDRPAKLENEGRKNEDS